MIHMAAPTLLASIKRAHGSTSLLPYNRLRPLQPNRPRPRDGQADKQAKDGRSQLEYREQQSQASQLQPLTA